MKVLPLHRKRLDLARKMASLVGDVKIVSPLVPSCNIHWQYSNKLSPLPLSPIPLPFFPSSLSPTPYPFRRLLRRLIVRPQPPLDSIGRCIEVDSQNSQITETESFWLMITFFCPISVERRPTGEKKRRFNFFLYSFYIAHNTALSFCDRRVRLTFLNM